MSVPMDLYATRLGTETPPTSVTPNWTIDVSDVRTVKVSNISLNASEQVVREFFSFSGDIEYVEMQRESEESNLAYVTFTDTQGADTAMLLTGATIIDRSVNIMPVENYQLPPSAIGHLARERKLSTPSSSAVQKAEDVVSSMLAKGFVLGKDAVNKAREFDERLHLTSNASATVASLNQKIGLSEKISVGTAAVNGKVREMDERFQLREKTKSVLAVAENTVSNAGSALMNNRYVSTSASWVSGALNRVAKAAEDVSQMTKEKVVKAEEEKKDSIYKEKTGIITNFAQIHLDESFSHEPTTLVLNPVNSSGDASKLGII